MSSETVAVSRRDAASEMKRYEEIPVLVTTVDISAGVSVQLSVYPGDDPAVVAGAFCAQHGLAESVVGPLAQHIQENLREGEDGDGDGDTEGADGVCDAGEDELLQLVADVLQAERGPRTTEVARLSCDVSRENGDSNHNNSEQLMNRANEAVAEVAAALESLGLGERYLNSLGANNTLNSLNATGKVRPAAANSSLGAEFYGRAELPTALQRRTEDEDGDAAERLYADHFRKERMLDEQRRIQELENQLKMQQVHCTEASRAMAAHRTAKGYSSYGERLYKEGVEDAQKKEAMRRQAQAEQMEKEMSEVTFRPQISKMAQTMKAKERSLRVGEEVDAWSRLYHANAAAESKKLARHEAIRKEQDDLEMKECSFQPQLSKKSERMMEQRRRATSGTLPAYDRLHYQGAHQKANWELKKERIALPEEATFCPEINPASIRRAERFNKNGPADVADRLLIRGQVYHERLEQARAELSMDIDPVTGQKLFHPKVNGRVPKNRQEASSSNVGEHLYQEALQSAKRIQEFRDKTNHQVDMDASKTHVNESSHRMIERLKLDRIKAVFAYLARTPVDCLPPESIDIVAVVSNERFMDTIDPEVRADVELAAKIAMRRKMDDCTTEGAGISGGTESSNDDDSEPSAYITETEFIECMYEVINRTRGYTRTYLLPMPGTRVKWEEPTFKPELSEKSMRLASRSRPANMPNHEILYNAASDTAAKIEQMKRELDAQEMELCTFKPKLSSNIDSRPARGKALRGLHWKRMSDSPAAETNPPAPSNIQGNTVQHRGIKSSLFHVDLPASSYADNSSGDYELDSPDAQVESLASMPSMVQQQTADPAIPASVGDSKKKSIYDGIDAIENEIKEAIAQLSVARDQRTKFSLAEALPEFNVDRKMAISLPEPDRLSDKAPAMGVNGEAKSVNLCAEF